jgi:hypothetical protein
MAKYGVDEEMEKMTEQWLRENDENYNKKNKGYHSNRAVEQRSKKEIPLSSLGKKDREDMEEKYYSKIIKGD